MLQTGLFWEKHLSETRRQANAINILAVANAAGVSKTTVSHVLSGKRAVAEKTRQRVLKIMDEIGFKPNFFAQALMTQKSHTIALLTQDITNPFYPALARGVQQAASVQNQILMLFDAGPDGANIHSFLQVAGQRRVDGVIAAVSNAEKDLQSLHDQGIPIVTVGPSSLDVDLDWVSVDDQAIGADAVRALHAGGHRRIGIISGHAEVTPGSARLRGYTSALDELGLPTDPILQQNGDWSRESGAAAMARLLDLADPPTAVFCANDLMAIGALDAAFARGISVPGKLAVIGVDDIDAAGLVRPALTTFKVPAHEIGVAAGELLLSRMTGDESPIRHILLPHTLVTRDSI
jgi:DNA-binding LacI/PurR family transcriptional regulator